MNEAESFQSRSEKEIFFETLDKNTPQERAAFLDGACGKNPALRARVEALLTDHFQEDSFMEKPAAAREEPIQTIKLEVAANPDDNAVGQTIGRYKLLEKLGVGGCGAFFVAQQNEPVRRRVALKVIKLGMDTKEVIARFEAERQALAMMDHPNIAKVLDAGTTETGRPYFVMELVRGIKITEYCDQNQLNTKERLTLLIEVCHAVQHAHQKGIIHRDIKPSNIMVTLHDGVPVPKIIDFGIAKATEGRLTDETVYTQLHQFIGTPAYMSPEQAEMSGLDIDTRSDIYSLGVLLYELLAGSTPFDAKELMASGLDAMRKIIREQEPVRPSTRFATLHGEDLTTTAKRRSTDTSKLLHQLRGDLDWIVMKCLEKDRTRRYETANGLAMDIQRHLQNELVVARPPSDLYRFQKLVRRNKLAFIAVGAVTAALIIGLGVATWSFFIEQQALRQAEADRKIAKTEAAKAIAISDFFQQSLRAANPDESKSSDYTVRQLLDDYSTGLEGRFPNQPAVEAAARETIGKAYYRLGIGDKAQAHLERALALNRQLYGEHEQVAATLADCAWASSEQNQTEKAESEARAALEIYRKDGITGQPVLFALWALESTLHMERRYADSVIVGEQALDIARRTPNTELPETAGIIGGLADSKNGQSKFAEAEPLARKAVDMHRRLQGSQHPETGWALVGLGQALEGQNKFDEAERSYREALTIFRRHYRSGHKSLDYARSYLGEVLEAKRDVPGLVALDQTTLADQRSILGENSPAVANTLVSLADHLRVQGKQPEADGALQEAATILFRLREKAPTLRDSEGRDTINAMNGLANSYSAVGRDKEAIFLLGQVCEVNPKDTEASLKLATWQAWFGQDTDYEATRGRLVQQAEGTDQPGTAERAAKAYCLLPSTDAALLAKALTLARRGVELGQNSSFMCWYQLCLGLAENRNGHYAVAEEALAMAEQMAGDHRELQGTARFFRAMCLFQQNRPEEARKLFSQAETEMPPFPKDERKPVVDGKPVSHEVLICWLAYKEAKALIESNAKAGDHPK